MVKAITDLDRSVRQMFDADLFATLLRVPGKPDTMSRAAYEIACRGATLDVLPKSSLANTHVPLQTWRDFICLYVTFLYSRAYREDDGQGNGAMLKHPTLTEHARDLGVSRPTLNAMIKRVQHLDESERGRLRIIMGTWG